MSGILMVSISAAEFVQKNGLAALRGVPLCRGSEIIYVSDKSLDDAIDLWADEPEEVRLRMESKSRLYGSEVRNHNMVSWIYLKNVTLAS
jgi:hypothetical protein